MPGNRKNRKPTKYAEFRRLLALEGFRFSMKVQGELWAAARERIGDNASVEDLVQEALTYIDTREVSSPRTLEQYVDESMPRQLFGPYTPEQSITNPRAPAITTKTETYELDSDDEDAPLGYPSPLVYSDELNYYMPGIDPAARSELLRSVLAQSGISPKNLLDDLGQPLPMESLLEIAQVSPIWDRLSGEQKLLFLEQKGVLPSGKEYISKRIKTEAPRPRKTLMQLSNGQRVFV